MGRCGGARVAHFISKMKYIESVSTCSLNVCHNIPSCSRNSRLGGSTKKKKSGETGKVGKWESREIVISEISKFSMHFTIWKIAEISDFKGPPLWFFHFPQHFQKSRENQRGGPLKSEFFTIFQIVKSIENLEISEIMISRLSHFPSFPVSPDFFFFSSSRRAENLEAQALEAQALEAQALRL